MKWTYKKGFVRTLTKVKSLNIDLYKKYCNSDAIVLKYWDYESNWGDSVNPYLIEKLTGLPVVSSNRVFNFKHKIELLGVGSIVIGNIANYVIWGSGIFSENTKLYNKPKAVLALRGHYTLKRIRETGADCNLFGDPALLFPQIFPDNKVKKYKYGIIPHYKDKQSKAILQLEAAKRDDALIIDIQSGIEEFPSQLLQCENIISSSLHGIILADAYGIPTCKALFSDKVFGGDFKFLDYYSGVGIHSLTTIDLQNGIEDLPKAMAACSQKDLKLDSKGLLQALTHYINNRD